MLSSLTALRRVFPPLLLLLSAGLVGETSAPRKELATPSAGLNLTRLFLDIGTFAVQEAPVSVELEPLPHAFAFDQRKMITARLRRECVSADRKDNSPDFSCIDIYFK